MICNNKCDRFDLLHGGGLPLYLGTAPAYKPPMLNGFVIISRITGPAL